MYQAERSYYLSPDVHSRIVEYCGGSGGDANTCTARFLVSDGRATFGLGIPGKHDVTGMSDLDSVMERGVDILRSLWDTGSLLAVLDLDYQNSDNPYEALNNPQATFEKMEPVFQSVSRVLKRYNIKYTAVMTGKGYHFVWRVDDSSEPGNTLRTLTEMLPTIEAKYQHDHPFSEDTVPRGKAISNAGLGLVMEYIAHCVIEDSASVSFIPTILTGLVVGSGRYGRQAISLDLSAHGDPLYMRYFRCAFSLYRKPSLSHMQYICLVRDKRTWIDLLPVRSNLQMANEYAGEVQAVIPEASEGMSRLLDEYLTSELRKFHVYYGSGQHDQPETWQYGYDRLNLSSYSPCVAWPLAYPKDAIANPGNVQNVARVLVSDGWHPRAVAGLIRSKFERDYGWGIAWLSYDAATRADFYVRLFCGAVATGVDDLRDFNCVSHQEKGLCPKPWCGFNLADYRERLLKALR